MKKQLVIIGGGPAGMAAAVAVRDHGIEDILILERAAHPGGILRQCIHSGFGLHKFKEELTGPEYAWKYEQMIAERGIELMTGTMVIGLTQEKVVTAVNPALGVFTVEAQAVILAMGCRERPRGALNIPGTRPAGILTAGTAQKFVNIDGYLPGKRVVILGSGDIGLIMARRMTLEGAKVEMVCELLPYSGGLARNIEQCLNDFGIPLLLSHTVTEIHGDRNLQTVTVSQVNTNRKPIPGTERLVECDTLLLSVGLIPENELTAMAGLTLESTTGGTAVDERRETAIPGIFACGNVLHVHDLVDFVSDEAELAGHGAAAYIQGKARKGRPLIVAAGTGVRYTVPRHVIERSKPVKIYFRVTDVFRDASVVVRDSRAVLFSQKKSRLAPGEMESVTLAPELLKRASGDILTVMLEVQNA
ncbi:MAG: NAD(P)/FAD-dependent oxidoreductase [Oscillospiraceae bacterium]|jgi:NADPH-dependent 2,4-dienoyl-CoA reductase/sulfur reductase-like enzyme|nr:NAD(P)/FAD-dependent oxidoreductase [Oscillospiraceae bacterium]